MDDNFPSFNFNANSCRCTCLNLQELRSPARGVHLVTNISVVIVNILITIPGIMLNTFVLIAYAKNRRLHTSANLLLMALSLSDLCIGIFAQPLWVTKKILELFVTFNCYIWVANRLVVQGTCGVSLLIISALSVERFVTLAYPFRAQAITRFRLKVVMSTLSTLLWVFVLCEVFIVSDYVIATIVGSFIIFSVVLVIVIWLWIHRLVLQHKRQIVTFHSPAHAVTSFKTVMRNTKTSYLVSGSAFLCFSPSFATSVYFLFGLTGTKSATIHFYIIPWFSTPSLASSLINPLILLYRKNDYRNTIKNLLWH